MKLAQNKPKATSKTEQPSLDDNIRNVGHLFRRAGFGDTPTNILTAAQAGLPATIAQLVDYQNVQDNFTAPDPSIIPTDGKNRDISPLTQWWLQRMMTTSRPLQEKMVLFWHGHFATATYKVANPGYMYRQNQLFRDNALGTFDDLLLAVYKDPAMLIWLDGQRNTKLAPNENYGREVMELFTLGRATGNTPNYTENDVHANAKAFTGWRIDPTTGAAVFNPRLHDDSVKTLLGNTGNWNGDDASRILAAQPATANFLSTKLWQFFASDNPPAAVIQRMADTYMNTNHSIREVVRVMFSAPEFYGQDARTSHVKSPTDFLVTPIKQLGLTNVDTTTFPRVLAVLGQELFNPVNVGGWPGGMSWLNSSTMLNRFNFASRITGNIGAKGIIDPQALLDASGAQTADQLVYFIVENLGMVNMSAETESALLHYAGGKQSIERIDAVTKTQGLVHLAMISPEYQIA